MTPDLEKRYTFDLKIVKNVNSLEKIREIKRKFHLKIDTTTILTDSLQNPDRAFHPLIPDRESFPIAELLEPKKAICRFANN